MKIYITGISGMLGDSLFSFFSKTHEVTGCDLVRLDRGIDILDLTDIFAVKNRLNEVDFDVLIHTAANINVDGCEKDPELAYKINSEVTANLASICKEKSAKMVYVSTDAVFSGNKNGSYLEEDPTDPINVYGESKLIGEVKVKEILDNYLILRTNIYGWNRQTNRSFAQWVIGSYEKGEKFNMFTDVYYTPIYVGNFAEALSELIDKEINGLFHLVGSDICSKYDFGIALGRCLSLDTSLVEKESVDSFPFFAKRSKNMCLDCSKLASILETPLLGVEDGIKAFLKDKSN